MKKAILLLFNIFFIVYAKLYAQSEFDDDYNSARIENEYKYAVPIEIYDSVWSYMRDNYGSEKLFLRKTDTSFVSSVSDEAFIDQYFDNKAFQLLIAQNGIRYRTRKVLSDSANRKNNRELMQIKINGIDSNALNRAEYKYPIKHYSASDKGYESSPFLNLIKRSYREAIIKTLDQLKIDANTLKPFIVVDQNRKRVYIYKGSMAFSTITLDSVTATQNKHKVNFVEIEMEINEIAYTRANDPERKEMEKLNKTILEDLIAKFPQIKQDQMPKYNKAYNRLKVINQDFDQDFLSQH
jgi:hypothetical protein